MAKCPDCGIPEGEPHRIQCPRLLAEALLNTNIATAGYYGTALPEAPGTGKVATLDSTVEYCDGETGCCPRAECRECKKGIRS